MTVQGNVIPLQVRKRETTMSRSPKSKAAARAEPAQPRHATARLNAMMACDTAFRIVARRCLGDLTAHHEATCKGDPAALHQMRIALTRLRTAILFFFPMVDDVNRTRVKDDLRWLNGQLGIVRDLDVAMERLDANHKRRPQAASYYQSWNKKRADSHRHLAQALRSVQYRRLIESISAWVENGAWSIKEGRQAAQERALPVAVYGVGKLSDWREKLLKKRRKLLKMDTKKRHRLRLLNKKLCYSIESLEDLFPDKRFKKQRTALKHLRKAQKSLGQLNDDTNSHSLASALERDDIHPSLHFLSPKRERRQ